MVENDKTSANVQDSDASATVDKTPLCTVYGDMWILYDSGTVQYSSTVYGYRTVSTVNFTVYLHDEGARERS